MLGIACIVGSQRCDVVSCTCLDHGTWVWGTNGKSGVRSKLMSVIKTIFHFSPTSCSPLCGPSIQVAIPQPQRSQPASGAHRVQRRAQHPECGWRCRGLAAAGGVQRAGPAAGHAFKGARCCRLRMGCWQKQVMDRRQEGRSCMRGCYMRVVGMHGSCIGSSLLPCPQRWRCNCCAAAQVAQGDTFPGAPRHSVQVCATGDMPGLTRLPPTLGSV